MLKFQFFIRTEKVKVNGECPIFVKINLDRKKSFTLSIGKCITKERWEKTNRLRSAHLNPREKVIKEYFNLFEIKVTTLYSSYLREQKTIEVDEFKSELVGKPKDTLKGITLVGLIDLHNTYFEKLVKIEERSPASLQKYRRVKQLVIDFNRKHLVKDDVAMSKIDGGYIYNLESYLKFDSTHNDQQGIKNNTVVKYFKNLKTICNYAIKMDKIEKNPFNKYDGKIKVVEATFLTQEELTRIESKVFGSERLERVKDIFLFSCYTGYAPIDAAKLTTANIIQDSSKNLWIQANRQKTGTKANVPILPPVIRIINKYQYSLTTLLPKLSNQKMNAYLKEIADIVGISKNLTWYVARHTFATTVTLGNKISIENVSAMMGHSTIKQTQHYANVLDNNVMDYMQKLIDKFKDQ
jgi:site-specific recombinase XerD